MKSYQYLFFIILVLFVFVFYVAFRETIIGADSAAFIGYSCNHSPIGKDGKQIGIVAYGLHFSQWFYEHLPCDMLLFKALACLNLLICIIILAKTGELFDKDYGWLLGLFVFLNGLFLPMLLDFEEEQLSFPFLFLACYFLLKHIKQKESWRPVWLEKNLVIGFVFVLLAGLFWKGAIYYLPLFELYLLPATIIFVLLLVFAFNFLKPMITAPFAGIKELITIGGFTGKSVMQEAMLGFGFIQQWLLLVSLLNKNKFLWLAIIYTLGLAFLAMRFSILPIPFLGAGLIAYLKQKPNFRQFFIIVSLGFLLFSCWNLQKAFPTNEQIENLKKTIVLADGNYIAQTFGLGWWAKLFNGKTNFYSGFPEPDYNNWHGFALTNEDTNCQYITGKTWKIYDCP